MLVTIPEYKRLTKTKVSEVDLRNLVNDGKLKGIITSTGRYLIDYSESNNNEEVKRLQEEVTKLKTIIENIISIGKEVTNEKNSM